MSTGSCDGTPTTTVCCVSEDDVLSVWDVRTRKRLARLEMIGALKHAGWDDASRVRSCAQCPYAAQYVVATAGDTRGRVMGIALFDTAACKCISYSLKDYGDEQNVEDDGEEEESSEDVVDDIFFVDSISVLRRVRVGIRRRRREGVTTTGFVAEDGTVYGGSSRTTTVEEEDSRQALSSPQSWEEVALRKFLSARGQLNTIACPKVYHSVVHHSINAVALCPDGIKYVALPQRIPRTATSRRIDWNDAVIAQYTPQQPFISMFALHPNAYICDTLLCANATSSSLFHISPPSPSTTTSEIE